MIDVLRDPIWQTVLGFIAILISISTIRLNQNIKEITCKIQSITPLFDINDDMKGKLKLLFDGKPVKNVFLVILKIVNSGKIPITAEDQTRPITIEISAKKVLETEIVETHPLDMDATVSVKNNSIILKPTLLNPDETITIKTITESFSGIISTSGRIVGANPIQTIMPNSDSRISWLKTYKWAIIGGIIGLIGLITLIVALKTFIAPAQITVLRSGSILQDGTSSVLEVDNCRSSEASQQTESREFNDKVVVYLGNNEIDTSTGDFYLEDVGTLPIGQRIAELYGLSYGQEITKTMSVSFVSPFASKAKHTINNRYRYGTGIVSIFQPSKNRTIEYDYKILIDIESGLETQLLLCDNN